MEDSYSPEGYWKDKRLLCVFLKNHPPKGKFF